MGLNKNYRIKTMDKHKMFIKTDHKNQTKPNLK